MTIISTPTPTGSATDADTIVFASAPQLETPRLSLRGWDRADLEPFAAINADPSVMRYFPAPLSRAQSDAMVARIQDGFRADGFGVWSLHCKDQRRCIGAVGLTRIAFDGPLRGAVEIAWRLASSHWGHGLALEAAAGVCDVAALRFGLDEIVSITADVNAPSWRVMEKLGMERDADFDHPDLPADSPLKRHRLYRLRLA